MKTLAAAAGVSPKTILRNRRRIIDRNPELKARFGRYGRKTPHILTSEQITLLCEYIPHLQGVMVQKNGR